METKRHGWISRHQPTCSHVLQLCNHVANRRSVAALIPLQLVGLSCEFASRGFDAVGVGLYLRDGHVINAEGAEGFLDGLDAPDIPLKRLLCLEHLIVEPSFILHALCSIYQQGDVV